MEQVRGQQGLGAWDQGLGGAWSWGYEVEGLEVQGSGCTVQGWGLGVEVVESRQTLNPKP